MVLSLRSFTNSHPHHEEIHHESTAPHFWRMAAWSMHIAYFRLVHDRLPQPGSGPDATIFLRSGYWREQYSMESERLHYLAKMAGVLPSEHVHRSVRRQHQSGVLPTLSGHLCDNILQLWSIPRSILPDHIPDKSVLFSNDTGLVCRIVHRPCRRGGAMVRNTAHDPGLLQSQPDTYRANMQRRRDCGGGFCRLRRRCAYHTECRSYLRWSARMLHDDAGRVHVELPRQFRVLSQPRVAG
jgi:hypothetical protein